MMEEITDLSGAPDEIKRQIIENNRKLLAKERERKMNMEKKEESTLGTLAAIVLVAFLLLWGVAMVLAPAAIIKWCLLFLLG